jgi:hypothetical protein
MEHERERLRDLSLRLRELHALLLQRERRAYESLHGPVGSHELLTLLLHDRAFAWLRSLSTMMAQIDAAVDDAESITPEDTQRALRATYRLLKSGESGDFQDRYRDALQDSPDIVMAHASVSEVLRDIVPR